MALSAKGTTFKTDDPSLMRALDDLRGSRIRVKVTYDSDWGSFGKDHDFGYVGRTTGWVKAPILLHNSRSHGGFILDDDHILRIESSKGGNLFWRRTG